MKQKVLNSLLNVMPQIPKDISPLGNIETMRELYGSRLRWWKQGTYDSY